MTFSVLSRYSEMVQRIVPGSFYESLGIVVPYRGNSITTLRLETSTPNTEFGVYINNEWAGTETTDSEGNIVFKRVIPKGENIVTLINRSNGRTYPSYITAREWAIWMSAYAEAVEAIDENIVQVYNNMSIATADLDGLETLYGEPIGFYSNLGQDLDSYRNQLHELRMAYRTYGSTYKGFIDAASVITHVPPFGYARRSWGPRWVLGQSFLKNKEFKRSASITSTGLITGVEVTEVESDVVSNPTTPHELAYDETNRTLQWIPDGAPGVVVPVADGELFLPGPDAGFLSYFLGRDTSTVSYSINTIGSNQNNHLYLNLDKLGYIDIQLVTGLPTPTPTQVAADINTALNADPRYGAPYSSAAAVYLSKLIIAGSSSVEICSGPYNAAGDIFGSIPGAIQASANEPISGIEILNVYGNENTSVFLGECTLRHVYDDTATPPDSLQWSSPDGFFDTALAVPESGIYVITDTLDRTLTVHVYLDLTPTQTGSPLTTDADFTISYSLLYDSTNQNKGCWVNVSVEDLPSSDQSDTITVYDDVSDGFIEAPDYWFIDPVTVDTTSSFLPSKLANSKVESSDPTTAYQILIEDPHAIQLSLLGHVERFPLGYDSPKGSNYPLKNPNGIYDYENFVMKFSGWFLSLNTGDLTVTLAVSFDGGDTWDTGTPTPINQDPYGFEQYTYSEFEVPIKPSIKYREDTALTWEDSGILVKAIIDKSAGDISILMDHLDVTVTYISSKYLGNATVSRTKHKSFMGQLAWIWSPEPLTITEKSYLGLPYTTCDKLSPYAGVHIVSLSSDTPTGVATMEYSYTSTGNIKKLRWIPYGTSWGVGSGWTTINSDGTYSLFASDSSSITVEVIAGLLPTLSQTKTVTVSNQNSNPGILREISPASMTLDVFDVSEYDDDGNPINLFGAITESDFSLCGLVNMEVQSANPTKYAYIYPEFLPQTGEELSLSLVGLNRVATLDYYCDMDQDNATLYENGIPVPNSMWSFTDETTVAIPQSHFTSGDLNLTSTFTLDYNLLYQVTTTVLDLSNNTDYADYLWLADYYLTYRSEASQGDYGTLTPIYFGTNSGRAVLANRSTANKTTANLYIQQSTDSYSVPKQYWRFIDDFTVELDRNYLVDGQYYLEHEEPRVYDINPLTIVFEHRSGATTNDCEAASWTEISRNEAIDTSQTPPHMYHQLRITVSGLRDLSDFKVKSLVIKGLNLRTDTPSVQGLTNVWLGDLYSGDIYSDGFGVGPFGEDEWGV